MLYWYFLTILLITFVHSRREDLYEFSHDQGALSKCIEDFLLNCHPYNEKVVIVKVVAKLTADKFLGQTLPRKNFFQKVRHFIRLLRTELSFLSDIDQVCKSLGFTLRYALVDCAKSYPKPIVESEPPELTNILDYILVYWPTQLADMITSRNGRMVLRKYTEDAQVALNNALNYLGHRQFRIVLREMWMQRARSFYFDGSLTQFPYLRYRYTMAKGVCVYDDIVNVYLTRRAQNFSYNNPLVRSGSSERFLKIHAADRPPYVRHDIFGDYKKRGMTSAEYYIETQIDQFHRILIFFMELQFHGIKTAEDDDFDGPLPCHILQADLQKIVNGNYEYGSYLLSLRECFKSSYGEDLISISSGLIKFRGVESDGNSTTTPRSITTTSEYDQCKRKGSVWVNDKGKHFLKRPRTTCEERLPNDDPGYGYVTNVDDLTTQLLASEKELVLSKIMRGQLFPTCGP